MTRFAIRFTVACLGLAAALWCLDRAVVGQSHYPRFHRYAMTRLDDTTTLDMVKDAKTGVCVLVYRAHYTTFSSGVVDNAVAATSLGPVPCDPIPVPPVAVPPASAVR